MILEWFHRKFVEILLDSPRGIHYNPEINGKDKNDFDTNDTFMFPPVAKGHRYRYYIPQVNIRQQLTTITDPETDFKAVETVNYKCSCENGHGNKLRDMKSENHRIRKLFLIPLGSERSTEHFQIVKNGTIREIYPLLRRFYVLPVLDGREHIRGNKQIEFDDNKQEEEDSNLFLGDIIDDDAEAPFEAVMSPRDILLNKPFMEFDSIEVINEEIKSDAGEHIGNENNFKKEVPKFDSVSLSEGWWYDLDSDYPISHKKLENRLVNTSEAQKSQKSFTTVFKNLFVRENEADVNN